MEESRFRELVNELNELSEDTNKNMDRMVEIAKVLLAEHYRYLPKKNNNEWVSEAKGWE